MNKTYKGLTKTELVNAIANYKVKTAIENNTRNPQRKMNTNKADYVRLYKTYPINSKSFFSLAYEYNNIKEV